jgi:serine protease Do
MRNLVFALLALLTLSACLPDPAPPSSASPAGRGYRPPPPVSSAQVPRRQQPATTSGKAPAPATPAPPDLPPVKLGQASGPFGAQAGAPVVPIPGAPGSFADLVQQVEQGVVYLYTTQVANDPVAAMRGEVGSSLGTGFIVDDQGYILTNFHVVEGASDVRVKLHDNREFQATIVGGDPSTDLALVRISAFEGIRPIPLGDSDTTRVGDWVVAIGNPFGLSASVTAGIISAKQRRDVVTGGGNIFADFLQTDTSINPGNSGGPLINMAGQVVGINTAINAKGQGIGFSIPINLAKKIATQLQSSGHAEHAWLGVQLADLDPSLAMQLRLPEPKGAVVANVVLGGPADASSVQRLDVVTSFEGRPIECSADLRIETGTSKPGTTVNLGIVRDGSPMAVAVTLGSRPR